MDKEIYKDGDTMPDLEFEKSIKFENNLKEIFSFLERKRLFKLIIYNKNLQKTVKINIEDYKKISGKYKIGKKDGIGKVYKLNTKILKFEGEYLKGKKNGKGKEYDDKGKLVFEGEYLNGKRNGKGKEYYYNGKLIFDGEYLNGKRNGKGKQYDHWNGKLVFEGEFFNGKKWTGKEYNLNGNVVFQINNGKGKGKEYDYDGKLNFEGEYLNGERNGIGEIK